MDKCPKCGEQGQKPDQVVWKLPTGDVSAETIIVTIIGILVAIRMSSYLPIFRFLTCLVAPGIWIQ